MLLNALILAGILIALWLLVRWFSRASAATVSKAIKRAGLAALVVLGLWLVLTGKLAGLFAVGAGLAPWIGRALRLHGLWRMLKGLGGRTAQASPGRSSTVDTRFLRMSLDHDTGALDGEILDGPGRGRRLSELDFAQAMNVWTQVQADPASAQVMEAWLDRAWPDWRAQAGAEGAGQSPPPPPSGGMTRDEAWEILGLKPGAGADEIKAAHRRLMRQVHPDHGGSTWLASRINQARDLLLE